LSAGEIARHLKKSHKVYQERLDNTCRLLREQLGAYLTFERPNGGLAIWAAYRKNISARAVALNAEKLGLKISDGCNYFFQPNTSLPHDFIRIGYCSLDETEMSSAIDIWKKALIPFAVK
jgi:GntR family transcriptional regulator/MocR family aminotransferase